MRRSWIPVRLTIHSSEVSTSRVRSSFVMTRDGAYIPQPVITAFVLIIVSSCAGVDLDQRLLTLHQRATLDEDAGHPARHVRLDLIEQLHGLDQADDGADPDFGPVVDVGPGSGR